MSRDYYDVLGVKRDASEKELRQAYRRLARKHHPDVNRGDATAEERFKEINEAYQVLSDADSRRKYDRFGQNWKYADRIDQGQPSGFSSQTPFTWTAGTGGRTPQDLFGETDQGFGNLLGDLFVQRPRRRSSRQVRLEQPVEVSLEEAYRGASRVITLTNHDGARRRLEVKVPPGVDTGSRVRIPLDGQRGGDLTLVIRVQPHSIFQRKGRDLYTEVTAPLYDALLGGEVHVSTLKGKGQVALTIPPNTQNGKVFRLSGQGMPLLDNPQVVGDLFATVKVELPQALSDEEQELVQRLKTLRVSP